ncbi:hypothetical protein Bbelb_130910 [Branchiostoma belcheri]|nr:hypothetical protein Bbelb_130910 [Branchiostoma belcheri]
MAAQINASAGDRLEKTCETPETGDKRSILAIHTRQTVNSELNLSFLSPVHLAGSSAAKDVFQQDASQGSLPARHSTVSLLGDARAGKTSLEKHLLNQSFDPAEEATKGLEFDVVQTDVTEVNEVAATLGGIVASSSGCLVPASLVVLLTTWCLTDVVDGSSETLEYVLSFVAGFITGATDTQARLLRKTIMEVASSSFQSKRNTPIKWLKVSDFVSKYKSGSTDTCLLDKRTLFDKLRQEGVTEAEEGREDFEEMLKFYDDIGEIKVMGDVVVLNLKALVQLVVELVEFDCDDHDVGIVHVSSLRRVWKFLTVENFRSAIELFERFDILCPISQEQYLVPLLLETREETQAKEVETGRGAFWNTAESDTVLYFKFYKFHPEAIFLRLLARCLARSQETHDLGRGADRDVYRNVGRFYQGHDFYYKVELVCQSVQQNMIQVTVKCAPNRGPHSLLSRLYKDLQQIRDRDFPYLNYTVGLPCPACNSSNNHEGESSQAPPHILRVSGHDEELPRPGEKVTLMCRGIAFDVDLGQHQSTLDVAQTMKPDESSKTLELRSGHGLLDTKTIQHLSILLDPPAPIFGNNWRMLADELGLCFQDISYIESKHNPTEMVLDMYATNTQTPTVQQVHRALIDIDRPDAAGLLDAIVEQKPSAE